MRTATHVRSVTPAQEPDRRLCWALFALAACTFVLLSAGAITESDGRANYETTRSLVERRSLAVAPEVGVPGRGGYVSRYGLGLPVVSVPLYVLAKPAAMLAGDNADLVLQAAVSMTMPLIGALLVVAMFALARRVGSSRRAALLVSVGGVCGTYVLVYTKTFFAEPLVALALVLAIERILAGRGRHAGWALALGVATRVQLVSVLPVFVFVLWRRGQLRRALPGIGAGIGIALAHNMWRFGSPFALGYDDAAGFTTPVLEGTWGLLTHPAKSVVLFAPLCVSVAFALRRVPRDAAILALGSGATTFVLAAAWWSWMGGWSWGPRLVLPAVVPLLPLIGPWIDAKAERARTAVALIAIGALVSLPAMIVSPRAQQLDSATAVAPGIARQYQLIPSTVANSVDRVGEPVDDARRYVGFWQFNVASVLGAPGLGLAGVGSLVLIGGMVAAARRMKAEFIPRTSTQTDASTNTA